MDTIIVIKWWCVIFLLTTIFHYTLVEHPLCQPKQCLSAWVVIIIRITDTRCSRCFPDTLLVLGRDRSNITDVVVGVLVLLEVLNGNATCLAKLCIPVTYGISLGFTVEDFQELKFLALLLNRRSLS